MTFRELIDAKYLSVGISKEQMLSMVYVATGVSRSSLRAAFNGTQVSGQTAKDLCQWALVAHKTELDFESLVLAPAKAQKVRSA